MYQHHQHCWFFTSQKEIIISMWLEQEKEGKKALWNWLPEEEMQLLFLPWPLSNPKKLSAWCCARSLQDSKETQNLPWNKKCHLAVLSRLPSPHLIKAALLGTTQQTSSVTATRFASGWRLIRSSHGKDYQKSPSRYGKVDGKVESKLKTLK